MRERRGIRERRDEGEERVRERRGMRERRGEEEEGDEGDERTREMRG